MVESAVGADPGQTRRSTAMKVLVLGKATERSESGEFASPRSSRRWTAASSGTYHLLPSVRGDLLAKLGRSVEARAEFERAAELTSNKAERAHLLARANGA